MASTEAEPFDLACVPHAGGSARTFLRWQRSMPPSIRVVPLEMAGRGRRTRDPRPPTLTDAAVDLAARLDPRAPYAILGHSLGGLIAYEMARLLSDGAHIAPSFVVLAACRPPHLLSGSRYALLADLSDDDLIDELAPDGRIPESVRHSAMRQWFLPVIRGDIALAANYLPDPVAEPLPVNLLVWHGIADPATPPNALREWQRYTSRLFSVEAFPGGHFFIHDDLDHVADLLTAAALLVGPRPNSCQAHRTSRRTDPALVGRQGVEP